MSDEHMTIHLRIWRQKDRDSKGRMVDYTVENVDPDMSFLEMLDILNEEPFRARGFPVIKDLVVDRSAFDRIIAAGGYTSINAGGAQDANAILIPKEKADLAMDAASCIGCGACVAACPNASASLFVAAKISQFALLPQGAPERKRRAQRMIEQMDKEGFGNCSNHGECEAVCPKKISISNIARMRREYFKSVLG
jgi:succinate dehydrogenase / fumarate reductase iron-sulfur subunit